MNQKQIIVLGGGAAGFFAAINCAQLHKDCHVSIIEKSSKLLSKVRISGGGRCNVANACFDNALLVKNYPRGEKELRNVFSRFSTKDTISWFTQRGVELKTEPDGRIFPVTDNSETVVNSLLMEAIKAGVTINTNVEITEIVKNDNSTFTLTTNTGDVFECAQLIIATGGNSNASAYDWLKKFGHTILKPVPSLFTFNIPGNSITQLMGISVSHIKIRISDTKLETEGPLLITHWGMSGPAVLKASSLGARILNDLNYNFRFIINWLPLHSEEEIRKEFLNQRLNNPSRGLLNNCPFELPKRLWNYFLTKAGIGENIRWADLLKKNSNALIYILSKDEYQVQGKTTFKEEFVTCGGVSLKEINFSTMESKLVPNLYFAGEVMDIDGLTGGFNFQNAWSSGWVAALNAGGK